MSFDKTHGPTTQMPPTVGKSDPDVLDIEMPVGFQLQVTRRKTNISKTILITINKDQKLNVRTE